MLGTAADGAWSFGCQHEGDEGPYDRGLPQTTTYLNGVLREHCPERSHWTSFKLSRNQRLPVHRDWKQYLSFPQYVVSFGDHQDGGMWEETPPGVQGDHALAQVREDGHTLPGRIVATRHQAQLVVPQAWHGTASWEGERYDLRTSVCFGFFDVSKQQEQCLRSVGFSSPPLPPSVEAHGFAVQGRIGAGQPEGRPTSQSDERIKIQLYLLHAATGHGSTRHLVEALRRRGASARVLQLAHAFQCPICAEKRKVGSRHVASLEPLPPKLTTIAADIGHWTHPSTKEQIQLHGHHR